MSAPTHGRRVVVTGIGMLTPVGNDVASTWENILAGKSGAATIDSFDVSDFSVQFSASVKDFDVTRYTYQQRAAQGLAVLRSGQRDQHDCREYFHQVRPAGAQSGGGHRLYDGHPQHRSRRTPDPGRGRGRHGGGRG